MKIYSDNTFESRVWDMHMDGMSITQIAERLNKGYARIKSIILEGFRLQDPKYNEMVYGKEGA